VTPGTSHIRRALEDLVREYHLALRKGQLTKASRFWNYPWSHSLRRRVVLDRNWLLTRAAPVHIYHVISGDVGILSISARSMGQRARPSPGATLLAQWGAVVRGSSAGFRQLASKLGRLTRRLSGRSCSRKARGPSRSLLTHTAEVCRATLSEFRARRFANRVPVGYVWQDGELQLLTALDAAMRSMTVAYDRMAICQLTFHYPAFSVPTWVLQWQHARAEWIASQLAVTPDRHLHIYIVADIGSVLQRGGIFCGADAVTDPLSLSILTQSLPNDHEITHALSAYWPGWPPAYLREGLAECFGRSRDVPEIVPPNIECYLHRILSDQAFWREPSSLAFARAFVRYLFAEHGIDKLRRLYCTSHRMGVKRTLEKVYGIPTSRMTGQLRDFIAQGRWPYHAGPEAQCHHDGRWPYSGAETSKPRERAHRRWS